MHILEYTCTCAINNNSIIIHTHIQWSNRNCDRLLSVMSAQDRNMFDFNLRNLDWEEYTNNFCMGTKRYLLKEDMANLPKARKHMKR